MGGKQYTGQYPHNKTGDELALGFWHRDESELDKSEIDIEGFAPPGEIADTAPITDFDYDDFSEIRPVKYNVQIRDLGDEDYFLKEPLLITIQEFPGEDDIIASFPELELFGDGVTETEAIANLKFEILDMYDELIGENPSGLGEKPQAWLRILKSVIGRGAG